MATTTISSKYQVVIPKDVRKKLHLKSGQKMMVVTKGGIIHFIPEKPLASSLLQKYRENRYCCHTRPRLRNSRAGSSGYPEIFDFKEYGTPRGATVVYTTLCTISHCGWIPDKDLGNDE